MAKRLYEIRGNGTTSSTQPSADVMKMINDRAYYIWEAKGRPADSATEDWLQAEREIVRNKAHLTGKWEHQKR